MRVPTVRAADVAADAVILDVREHDEWVAGHVEGSRHIPMNELPARLHEVPNADELVVVCRVGSRSAQVTAYLNASGRRAVNLDGGLLAWRAAARPLATGTGAPATVL